MMKVKQRPDILIHLAYLETEKDFFRNVSQINSYNIDSIIELIQYENMKEYGDPRYKRREIRQGLKEYFGKEKSRTGVGFLM